ncbi:MAG: protein phosphatase 2C domain-containing protein [Opitutaceae bacterium]|jgi:protein phosphatase
MPPPASTITTAPAILWSGLTDKGPVRLNNEDAFLGVTFDGHEVRYLGKTGISSMASADFVFAVSDGMGGAKSGEFASRIAVEKITKLLPKGYRLSASGMTSGFNDLLTELFEAIHHELLKLGQAYEECLGMGATLSLCWFSPEWMYFAHIGDSRIYYLPKEGGMTQITHDHSQVGWMRRAGQLNEREARNHPRRNVLNQVLGGGNQFIDPHIGAVAYSPGDRFMICSDGLIDGLWDHHIEELIRTPAPAGQETLSMAQRLINAALENSSQDNITAIALDILPGTS